MHVRAYLISLSSLLIVGLLSLAFITANWYDYRMIAPGSTIPGVGGVVPQMQQAIADGWQPVPGSITSTGLSYYYRRPHLPIGQALQGLTQNAPVVAAVPPAPAVPATVVLQHACVSSSSEMCN